MTQENIEIKGGRGHFHLNESKLVNVLGSASKSSNNVGETTVFVSEAERILKFRNLLNRAIQEKKKVILRKYRSNTSGTIKDRYVEPVNFVNDGIGIWCYESGDNQHKQFKLSRIENIELLDESWTDEERHCIGRTDLFGWSGSDKIRVQLDMHFRAKNFLVEKYNNAKYLTNKELYLLRDHFWRLDVEVTSLKPVVKFYAMYLDAISIVDTPLLQKEFDDYLANYAVQVKMEQNYTQDEQIAILSLLYHVMNADGEIKSVEKRFIGKYFSKFNISFFEFETKSQNEAIEIVRTMSDLQKKEIIAVLTSLAECDNLFHPKEKEIIERLMG